MEIKNEQNLTDLLNDFIDRMTIGNNVISSLILIETKESHLNIYVKGTEKNLFLSLLKLCKTIPQFKEVMKTALEVSEQAKATDEAN